MQIAPKFEAAQWKALQLDESANPDWDTAISALDCRIHERYINPVDFLIAAEKDTPPIERRFGFTVIAIDCLLIETFGAFIEGLEDTDGCSKAIFCKFLTARPQFKNDFSEPLAKQFYKEFRCGVLHQAEVGGSSKVWSVGPLVQTAGDGLIINRNAFHARLKIEFTDYLQELRNHTNTELRDNFRKKMNFIARA